MRAQQRCRGGRSDVIVPRKARYRASRGPPPVLGVSLLSAFVEDTSAFIRLNHQYAPDCTEDTSEVPDSLSCRRRNGHQRRHVAKCGGKIAVTCAVSAGPRAEKFRVLSN